MILSGTIASTVQLQMLNNKWMQKKESGNVLSKQELNERSTWTSEQFMIADFQDQLEHNREAEKRQKIDNKIMSGGSLSPEEISYLEKNDPVALKKYRETKEEKESYKEKLRQCKTKEEVDRVKLQKLGELESSLSSIVNDPAIPKSAKLAKAQEILAKTNNIEAAHLEFVKSADYQSMPTDEEKKELHVAVVTEATQKICEKFLQEVLQAMGMGEVTIVSSIDEEGALAIEMSGDNMGILIGKRGQTLDSLQYLTNRVANKSQDGYVRVKLDTEDYRKRRKQTLENLAKNIAYKVKRSRKPISLEPMNPYERRIIHSALQADDRVSTHSEGEEPYRRVVVTPNRR